MSNQYYSLRLHGEEITTAKDRTEAFKSAHYLIAAGYPDIKIIQITHMEVEVPLKGDVPPAMPTN